MTPETEDYSEIRRKLMFRDALTFLSLVLVTILLFLVTFFLFRSFSAHRDELAKRWSSRGQAAISSGRPDQAIVALRTALSYAPGERSYELLLAQALGNAGHTEESYNYFLSLWETQPGDGFINLSLARLAAKKNDPPAAINYYRAAIYGTWEGDGMVRRREVRLELARFLIAHHDSNGARTVILVAGGNAPSDVPLDLELAQLLEQAGDPRDALSYYQNALSHEPRNQAALIAAGRLQYDSGAFKEAHLLLERAAHEREATGHASLSSNVQTMLDTSSRVLELTPFRSLSASERVARILKARDIAKSRFDQCSAQISSPGGPPASMQGVAAAWAGKEATTNRATLLKDVAEQDATMKLVFDTEEQMSDLCGSPTGDDAALLLLAKFPKTMEP